MGGQACVFYGAAQVSKDIDFLLLADRDNELLVTIQYRENGGAPREEHRDFWLREARTPELLVELCGRFPERSRVLAEDRPLLKLASEGMLDDLRTALDAEVRAEQALDRSYWEPLRKELEQFRREHRDGEW